MTGRQQGLERISLIQDYLRPLVTCNLDAEDMSCQSPFWVRTQQPEKKTKQWWRCSRLQSHKPQVDSCSNALMQETVWKSCNFSSSFHFFKVGVHWVVVSVWTRQSPHCHASHRSSWSCLPRWLPERATKGSVPGQQRRSHSTPRPKINYDKSLDILRHIRYYQRFPRRSRSPSLAATFWDNWARRCRLKFSESLFAFAR